MSAIGGSRGAMERDRQGILVQSCRRVSGVHERGSGLTIVDLKTNNLFPKAIL